MCHDDILFCLPNKLFTHFIGCMYGLWYVKLITLSGCVVFLTELRVSCICGVVTHFVGIVSDLVCVLLCTVCVIGAVVIFVISDVCDM